MKPAAQQQTTKQEQRSSYADVAGRATAAAAAGAGVGAGARAAHDHTKIQHPRQRLNNVPRKHCLPSSPDDDDFVTFKSRTNRRNIRRNHQIVVGTKKSDVYRSCRPQSELFDGSVPKEYPEQHVRDMVADTGVEIIDIKKISHADAPMMSYKLTIWRDAVDQLLQPTAWPEFITCRCWVRPRRYRDDNTHGNPPND